MDAPFVRTRLDVMEDPFQIQENPSLDFLGNAVHACLHGINALNEYYFSRDGNATGTEGPIVVLKLIFRI